MKTKKIWSVLSFFIILQHNVTFEMLQHCVIYVKSQNTEAVHHVRSSGLIILRRIFSEYNKYSIEC